MCAVSPAFPATVYKWVDEEGVLHLSDQPHPAAEKIELPSSPLYTAPPQTPSGEATPAQQESQWAGRYQQFVIEQPKTNEIVRSNDGSVRVAATLQPPLQPGHQLRFYLDGIKVKGEYDTPGIKLQGVERGPHTVKAEVLDENGKVLGTTAAVEFFLRKESEITPKTPPVDPDKPFKPAYPTLPQSDKTYPPTESGKGKYPEVPQSDKTFPPAESGKGKYPGVPPGKQSFPPNYQPNYNTKAQP